MHVLHAVMQVKLVLVQDPLLRRCSHSTLSCLRAFRSRPLRSMPHSCSMHSPISRHQAARAKQRRRARMCSCQAAASTCLCTFCWAMLSQQQCCAASATWCWCSWRCGTCGSCRARGGGRRRWCPSRQAPRGHRRSRNTQCGPLLLVAHLTLSGGTCRWL